MKEALALVKRDLGEDAIILKSRKIIRGGIFSFIAKEQIEITAAVDRDLPETSRINQGKPVKPADNERRSGLKDKYLLLDIRDDVEKIESSVNEIGQQLKYDIPPGLPNELRNLYVTMVNNGVDKEIAGNAVGEVYSELTGDDLENPAVVGMEVQKKLRKMFTVSGPLSLDGNKPTVLALIGPTGGGKTTTIAKIAAQHKFFMGKKVALISADTYRMAAIEQIRTFARISSLPLEIVYTPEDMRPAIDKHRDKDLIIIDTAGRSHRDKEKMRELGAFMEAADPTQIHLTLSASTQYSDLLDIVDRFRIVPSDYILITKLDETSNFGNILNLMYHRPKPISYLTVGQNVPDDISLADIAGLARMALCKDLEEAAISKGIYVRPSAETQRTGLN